MLGVFLTHSRVEEESGLSSLYLLRDHSKGKAEILRRGCGSVPSHAAMNGSKNTKSMKEKADSGFWRCFLCWRNMRMG